MDAGLHAEDLCGPWLARHGFSRTAAHFVALNAIAVDLFGSDIAGYYTRWAGPLATRLPWSPRSERLHFGSHRSAAELTDAWTDLENRLAGLLREPSVPLRLAALGASLHAVHDFYAHSTWARVDWTQHGFTAPTWHDVPAAVRATLDLYCSTAHGHTPLPGRPTHEQMNFDNASRPGFAVAFPAAYRATGQWLGRCAAWAGDGWEAMRRFDEQSAGIALDYRLVAELARYTGHWHGAGPVRWAPLLATGVRALTRGRGLVGRMWLEEQVGRRLTG